MAITRRSLLGVSAGIALGAAASACQDEGTATSGGGRSPTSPPATDPGTGTTATPPSSSAFAGQPRPGSLYYGAAFPADQSLSAWEAELGATLSLDRAYFTPDANEVAQLLRRCRTDLAAGRLPHVSMKPLGTWRQVAAGFADDWLASMFKPIGQLSGPVFFTMHHEPENDAGAPGMRPPDFVDMQRRLIRHAGRWAPNVTIVPVLQHLTFDPTRHDIDPREWITPEAAVFGLDTYNEWSLTNGGQWRTFGSLVEDVQRWAGETPLAIAEYGCRDDPRNPGAAAQWLRDAASYARDNNVVAMSYFNTTAGADDGSYLLDGDAERTFGRLLRASWVARV